MNVAYNMDCMEAMRKIPDKYFALAVVDPPYGGGGGYDLQTDIGLRATRPAWGPRGRFGGRFDGYHKGDPDRGNLGREVSDAHRGYL
nr:hypothetical protein [uncultured Dysosmobacter sp.]